MKFLNWLNVKDCVGESLEPLEVPSFADDYSVAF